MRYAQIDLNTGRCHTISEFAEEMDAPNLILLDESDAVNLGDIYDAETGAWTVAPPPEPIPQGETQEQKIARLEAEAELQKQQLAEAHENISQIWETLLFQ